MVIPILLFLSVLVVFRKCQSYEYLIDDMELNMRTKDTKTLNWVHNFWLHLRGYILKDKELSHSLNIIIHGLVCSLIYVVFGKNNVSLLAAILFAFNPVNTQVVCWISGKGYATSVLLLLVGMLVKEAFPLFYLGSLICSINTVFAPLVFVIEKPHYWVLLLLLIPFMAKRQYDGLKQRMTTVTPFMSNITWKRLIIVFKTYGYYFIHCLFPLKISMCHSYLHTYGIDKESTEKWYKLDKYLITGIILAGVAIYSLFNRTGMYLGFLWFTIFIAQWLNFIYTNHPITERYIYLANVGLMFMLAKILSVLPYGNYLALAFLIFYLTRLWYVMEQYKDLVTFWKTNAENFSDVALTYNQWGIMLSNQGKIGTSVDVMTEGLKKSPEDFRLNYNLANIMASMGDPNVGLHHAEKALKNVHKNSPNMVEMWRNHCNLVKENCIKRGAKVVITTENIVSAGVSPALEDGGKRAEVGKEIPAPVPVSPI